MTDERRCRTLMGWLRGHDLNMRPLGYEPNELPGCSTPHKKDTKPECLRSMPRCPSLVNSTSSQICRFHFDVLDPVDWTAEDVRV